MYQVSDLEAATKRKAIEVGDFVLHRGNPLYLGMRWYMDPFGDAYNTVPRWLLLAIDSSRIAIYTI